MTRVDMTHDMFLLTRNCNFVAATHSDSCNVKR